MVTIFEQLFTLKTPVFDILLCCSKVNFISSSICWHNIFVIDVSFLIHTSNGPSFLSLQLHGAMFMVFLLIIFCCGSRWCLPYFYCKWLANTIFLLMLDSHLPEKLSLFVSLIARQTCFLFHLNISFRSEDIPSFVLTFWLCRKNGSKFTMSNQVNIQLQYTYYPVSHNVKATKQWNLTS